MHEGKKDKTSMITLQTLPFIIISFIIILMLILTSIFYIFPYEANIEFLLPILIVIIISAIFTFYLILELARRIGEFRDVQNKTKEIILSETRKITSIYSSGVEKIYENQRKVLKDYVSIIEKIENEVDLLGATLISVTWSPLFKEATMKAVKRGVKFRILILNENSNAIRFLSKREYRSIKSFQTEIKESIERWKELQKKLKYELGSIEIRTYNDTPTTFLMIADDRLFFAHQLYSVSILSSPCIEVRKMEGVIYRNYKRHFEKMWENASPLAGSE